MEQSMWEENLVPPNSIFTRIDAEKWMSYVVFAGRDEYIAFEFSMEEFGNKAPEIASAILKGGDVARTLVEMKISGSSIEEMNMTLNALSMDGGL